MEFRLNDLHLHSRLSLCATDKELVPEAILKHAEENDYLELCLTDHLWDPAIPGASDWYAKQDIDHVRQFERLPKSQKLPFYFGCETELPANGVPALAREHFDLFDFVVIPPNHMHMIGLVRPPEIDTPRKMANFVQDRLEGLLEQDIPFRKVGIAHLTGHLMFREGSVADVCACMSEARLLRIFRGYAEAGAGIELNIGSIDLNGGRRDDMLLMYRAAKEAGCKFYCCSDAHTREELKLVSMRARPVIDALELTAEHQYRIPV